MNIKSIVENVLTEVKESRDSYPILYCEAIKKSGVDIYNTSLYDYFESGKYNPISPETVSRWSRKLQYENKNLRGDLYDYRHNNAKEMWRVKMK